MADSGMALRQRRRQTVDALGGDGSRTASTGGRHDELDKLREKGVIGGVLSLFILTFNAFALYSCGSAIVTYLLNRHVKDDVDLFKTILPQFMVTMTNLAAKVLTPRCCRSKSLSTSRDKKTDDGENEKLLAQSLKTATLCNETAIKCALNIPVFIACFLYGGFHEIRFDSPSGSIESLSIGRTHIDAVVIGVVIFVFGTVFRWALVPEPTKEIKSKSEWNPAVFDDRRVQKSIRGSAIFAIVMKFLQSILILPICDAFLFRAFFYHRLYTGLPHVVSVLFGLDGKLTTYVQGASVGNFMLACVVSLLNSAYDNQSDRGLLVLIPGLFKGLCLHLMIFSSESCWYGLGHGIGASIIAHAVANGLQCTHVVMTKQFWLWP